jgi:hypothetical protein
MVVTLIVMPVLLSGATSFWMPHSPFYHPKLAQFIDARLGEHALEMFLVRLKPLLLFSVTAVLQGLIGLWRNHASGVGTGAYAMNGFLVSGGVGFALIHAVLYRRRRVGVFPTWTIAHPVSPLGGTPPERLTLRAALRAYWWTLIGLALFPTTVVIGAGVWHIPDEFFILPFFGVSILAGWPLLARRAPYSFWLVAMGVWLSGGIVAAMLSELFRAVTA